jgi:hypothetical protein
MQAYAFGASFELVDQEGDLCNVSVPERELEEVCAHRGVVPR